MNYYVLIGTKNTFEHDVAKRLNMMDEVVDVEPLITEESAIADPFYEDYTLIAKINVDNALENIGVFVDDKIHTVKGVTKTKIFSR
jgi:hypothetical protein